MGKSFSLMIHGGAGAFEQVRSDEDAVRYHDSIRTILDEGRKILARAGSALAAVETCAKLLEDDPLFNAGVGSVLNEDGKVEMDAAIMDGTNLEAGAVAGVYDLANPIQLARLVMARKEHVMLTGEGAMRFADECDLARSPPGRLITEGRLQQLQRARGVDRLALDHDAVDAPDDEAGTVGAAAWDVNGNLAAATSTGGVVGKRRGRVGDTPIIGAGVFADNETCAASATGYGEDIMRAVLCKSIADFVQLRGLTAAPAVRAGIDYFERRVNGRGGVIVVDRHGNCASGFTTGKMIHGWIERGGPSKSRF
jgi:beta-aspartyl-peptidase (threonine type)